MQTIKDLSILRAMLRGMPSQASASEGLQTFYGPQAQAYDRFRERLLHGRREMIEALDLQPAQHVVDFGAGTGRMTDFYRNTIPALACLDLVDLCDPLLQVARQRVSGLPGVAIHLADATRWTPDSPADRVYFSYSLSMMRQWFAAVDNAHAALKPGGRIGVVDFQVAPHGGSALGFTQNRWARAIWPLWFEHDGVHLHPHLLAYLQYRFKTIEVRELMGSIPYLPGLKASYFIFVGEKI
jgi:S-adenosylmethionine-diacylgycerolhomoserine-N-methlytransferase